MLFFSRDVSHRVEAVKLPDMNVRAVKSLSSRLLYMWIRVSILSVSPTDGHCCNGAWISYPPVCFLF